jgi:hypothetical protein
MASTATHSAFGASVISTPESASQRDGYARRLLRVRRYRKVHRLHVGSPKAVAITRGHRHLRIAEFRLALACPNARLVKALLPSMQLYDYYLLQVAAKDAGHEVDVALDVFPCDMHQSSHHFV